MRYLIPLLIFLATPLIGNEELVVHLSTQESIRPLYLQPIQAVGSGFETPYVKRLEKILAFDLNYNGKTRVTSEKTGSEEYLVRVKIENKQLCAEAKTVRTGKVRGLKGIELTGSIGKDRRAIHKVADAIHASLFGSPGIASTRMIYTVRTRGSDDATKWTSEVWTADYDGRNARPLTDEKCLTVTPTFMPPVGNERAHQFLYVSYRSGTPKIYAAAIGQIVGKRLTPLKGNQLMPTFAPTLDAVAFVSDVTGNPDLFIQEFNPEMGLIGNPRQIFYSPGATQGTPTFSPDGRRLAFVSNKDGSPRIYMITVPPRGTPLKSIKATLVSKQTRGNTSPAWSPDGKKIAYSAMTHGTRQIWIHDLETGREAQLTDGPGHKENPTWAPNSLHLLYNSASETSCELYLTNLNQKRAVKISQGPGEKRFPSWEPLKSRKL